MADGGEEVEDETADPPSEALESAAVEEVVEVLEELGVESGSATFAAEKIIEISQENTTGRFPPPRMLGGYEQVLPGMADRIVVIAENAAAAEVQEAKDMAEDRHQLVKQRGRGQYLSVTITGAIVAAACVFFGIGNDTAGIAFLGSDVVLIGIALAGGTIDLPKRRETEPTDDGS